MTANSRVRSAWQRAVSRSASSLDQTSVARREPPSQQRILWTLRGLAVTVAVVRAVIGRDWMNADGVCYLDMADAWLAGDWSRAINSYWSPLYSWILAGAMGLVQPSAAWEFPLLHGVNVLLFVLALAAFEFYLHRLTALNLASRAATIGSPLSASTLTFACYGLFAWTTLELVTVTHANPDLLTVAAAFAATGLLIGIRLNRQSFAQFAGLGIVLGFGWLGKAVMLPLTPFFLAAAAFAFGHWKGLLPRLVVAVATFSMVASGYIIALSMQYGRPTFGDAGRLAYLVMVNGVNKVHWQGDTEHGTPVHPSRILHRNPSVYEFGEPRGGTYPVWYDPGYWYEGAHPKFNLRQQLAATKTVLRKYARLLVFENSAFAATVMLLVCTGVFCGAGSLRRQVGRYLGVLGSTSFLAIPSLAALGVYAAVYVDARYIGGFIALVSCWLIQGLRVLPEYQPALRQMGAAAAVVLWSLVAVGTARDAAETEVFAEHRKIAQGVGQLGLGPGDRIGHIGYTFDAFWARLAKLRVVAEVRPNEMDQFLNGTAEVRREVLRAFESTGAKAVVTYAPHRPGAEWKQLPDTRQYVLMLK